MGWGPQLLNFLKDLSEMPVLKTFCAVSLSLYLFLLSAGTFANTLVCTPSFASDLQIPATRNIWTEVRHLPYARE